MKAVERDACTCSAAVAVDSVVGRLDAKSALPSRRAADTTGHWKRPSKCLKGKRTPRRCVHGDLGEK